MRTVSTDDFDISAIKPIWDAGVQFEIDFWRSVFRGDDQEFLADVMKRLDAQTPIADYIVELFPSSVAAGEVSILDVGAGPVTKVGWHVNGKPRPKITPIDALAPQYRTILDEFKLTPPVYTQHCDGEQIATRFAPGSFDVINICNALDHCYDAMGVMRGMLTALKPGGALLVHGHTDEAEYERYSGLHQWNIRAVGDDMVIWRPNARFSIRQEFGVQIEQMRIQQPEAARWTSVTIHKRRAP